MNWLLLILSLMTFTVETKNSVSSFGEMPSDKMTVAYACTYQKGDVRNGDEATLTLGNTGAITLQSVTLYLRSNKSSGAGILDIYADGQLVFNQSGTYAFWFGAYDNTDYHPLEISFQDQPLTSGLTVRLTGISNSLHIEKYEIQYTLTRLAPRAVSLYAEGQLFRTLTENEYGAGVYLPVCEDRGDWRFYGWTATDLTTQTAEQPTVFLPERRFMPQADNTSLYAVWINQTPATTERLDELRSGYYILEHLGYGKRLRGTVTGGTVPLVPADSDLSANDVYQVDFDTTDSTCTIRHHLSGKCIGYNQSTLSTLEQVWSLYLLPDSTFLFYCHPYNGQADVLYPNKLYAESEDNNSACLRKALLSHELTEQWALYAVPDPAFPVYWYSYPSRTPVWIPQAEQNTYVLPFGIYELHIRDGKKTIRLNQ